jgi:hypothetical protein
VGAANPVIGREREDFIDIFLSSCIPKGFRFATGQAVDSTGKESNQLDIVVDSTFAPSIPVLGSSKNRHFPIESISSIIEVKSNFTGKWDEVVENCKSVRNLTLSDISGACLEENRLRNENIAYFAVGYQGWQQDSKLVEKWTESNQIDCVLQLDPLIVVHKERNSNNPEFVSGPMALLRFLELLLNSVKRNDYSYDLAKYYE